MSVDRLSNMLSALKNASLVNKAYIEMPHTKECAQVAEILKNKGFLSEVKTFKESGKSYKKLRLDIVYDNGIPKFSDIKRVSKPGRRLYTKSSDIKSVAGGFGVLIVSTSRGIMSGSEAKKKKLGGEILCKVW